MRFAIIDDEDFVIFRIYNVLDHFFIMKNLTLTTLQILRPF